MTHPLTSPRPYFLLATLVVAAPAAAQDFATPPEQAAVIAADPDDPAYDHGHYHPPHDPPEERSVESTVRLHTGPALRVSDQSPGGGLFAAADIGQEAAGLRLTGAWLGVGGQRGVSQYTGELWIDFAHERRLHPILGAGAGAARMEYSNAAGETEVETIGVGVMRASLQYSLPVRGTDARAGIDVVGVVPAIQASDSERKYQPWLLGLATIGVGF